MEQIPITRWYSNLGVGDGQDMATRGYLRSLLAVGYKYLVVSDVAQPITYHTSVGRVRGQQASELAEFEDLYGFPKHLRQPLRRVERGDPRIGQRWAHLPDETVIPVASHAPDGAVVARWTNVIREGEVDQEYYQEHPEELGASWEPVVEAVVAHFDPGQLARARDGIVVRGGGNNAPIVGITAWEADRLPAMIAMSLSDLDMLIVPSEHTKEAFLCSDFDVDCPIKVVPHALGMAPLSDEEFTASTSRNSSRYVFYTIGTDILRKNLRGVIEAYCRAFGPDFDGVGLVIKTSGGPKQLKQLYEDGVRAAGCAKWPRIAIYGERWPDEKMRRLHLNCDCWVDATRGEGFGLGQLEAAAMGNPVLTTGWGAQTEIVSDTSTITKLTPYTLTNVDAEMATIGVYDESQQWADPDIDALVSNMRDAAFERLGKRRVQADYIGKRYGLQAIGKTLRGALERAKRQ